MKKAELREKNRQSAIKVMKQCMLKYGITATTKDLVAKKSDLSMTSIVRYFRTKDNMVTIVADEIEKGYEKIYKDFDNLLADDSMNAAEVLKLFWKTTIDAFEKNSDIFLLHSEITHYMCRRDAAGVAMYNEHISKFIVAKILRDIFNKGVADGSLSGIWDVEQEVHFLINIIVGVMSNLGCIVKLEKSENVKIKRDYLSRVFASLYEQYTKSSYENFGEIMNYFSKK